MGKEENIGAKKVNEYNDTHQTNQVRHVNPDYPNNNEKCLFKPIIELVEKQPN